MTNNTTTITVENPTRTRKWGFGYTASVEQRHNPRTGDSYLTVTEVEAPSYTGTLRTVAEAIQSDRTLASFRSGGTSYRTQWFYDGRPIVSVDGEPFADWKAQLDLDIELGYRPGPATVIVR